MPDLADTCLQSDFDTQNSAFFFYQLPTLNSALWNEWMYHSIILIDILCDRADPGQPEVNLFHKADTNNDYMLTKHELDDLFLEFDANSKL